MNQAGGVVVEWIGNVLLVLAHGQFDDEASKTAAQKIVAAADRRTGGEWAYLTSTVSDEEGGALSTPDGLRNFQSMVNYLQSIHCTHAAVINSSIVADLIYGKLCENAGLPYQNFRTFDEAIAWLNSLGFKISLADINSRQSARVTRTALRAS